MDFNLTLKIKTLKFGFNIINIGGRACSYLKYLFMKSWKKIIIDNFIPQKMVFMCIGSQNHCRKCMFLAGLLSFEVNS